MAKDIIGDSETFIVAIDTDLETNDISVKFHEQQLGAVVRIEKQLNITLVEQ